MDTEKLMVLKRNFNKIIYLIFLHQQAKSQRNELSTFIEQFFLSMLLLLPPKTFRQNGASGPVVLKFKVYAMKFYCLYGRKEVV